MLVLRMTAVAIPDILVISFRIDIHTPFVTEAVVVTGPWRRVQCAPVRHRTALRCA
jgi:hypothetical protein